MIFLCGSARETEFVGVLLHGHLLGMSGRGDLTTDLCCAVPNPIYQ